jgi:outer membrane protein assembly factor BamB
MTDLELIDLLRQKPPDELSAEEISLLRARMVESRELREALREHLQLDGYLNDALGGMQVSVERVLASAAAASGLSPLTRWLAWGFGAVLAIVGTAIVVAPRLGWQGEQPRPVAQLVPDQAPVVIANDPPRPILPPADVVTVADAPSLDLGSQRVDGRAPAGLVPVDVAADAGAPTWEDDGSSPSDRSPEEVPVEDAIEAPWAADLDPNQPPLPFDQVCFDDFDPASPGPSIRELRGWLSPLEWDRDQVQDRPGQAALIDGLLKLRAPWPEDAALRLSLFGHDGWRLHAWHGTQGVTLEYSEEPRPAWAAYVTSRDGGEYRPIDMALAATDSDRYRRAAPGTVELRYHQRALVLSRGDTCLLRVPLLAPPEEIYFDGRAAVRGLRMARTTAPPDETSDRPIVFRSTRPADLAWESEFPEGAWLRSLPDGRLELVTQNNPSPAWVALPIGDQGLLEVLLRIESARPGAGVYLGDGAGQASHRVGFHGDGDAVTLAFATPEGKPAVAVGGPVTPPPWVGKNLWLRLIAGCGTLKCWTSGDGRHWSQAIAPLSSARGNQTWSHIGLYALPGERIHGLRLASIEVRELAAVSGLARADLRERAIPLADDPEAPLTAWLALADSLCPGDVAADDWRRACAVKTLTAPVSRNLANELLLWLVDAGLADSTLPEDQRRLLDEAALLADTWGAGVARDLAAQFIARYERLAAPAALGDATDSGARLRFVRHALLTAPLWTDAEVDILPPSLVRQALLAAIYADDWGAAAEQARRIEYWNRACDPARRLSAQREELARLAAWSRSQVDRHVGGQGESPDLAVGAALRHPLVEMSSREAYNILSDFNAALAGGLFDEACQVLTAAQTDRANGLAPDARDSQLLVSLAGAVAAAFDDHPELAQVMDQRFADVGLARTRRAMADGDEAAVRAATVRFFSTPAAAEAHLWLGDRALAAGDVVRATHAYRQAGAGQASDKVPGLAARLRLAAAMLGQDNGPPIARPVEFAGQQLAAADFEALVADLRARTSAAATGLDPAAIVVASVPGAWPAGTLTARPFARLDGEVGLSGGTAPAEGVDWVGRQLSAVVAGDLLLVNNRFQVAAFDILTAGRRWTAALGARQGAAYAWPGTFMRPLVVGDRVYVRMLSNDGPELTCLQWADGVPQWSARPGDFVASDPLVVSDQLLVLAATKEPDRTLRVHLATIDPRSGAVLAQRPLASVRDDGDGQLTCRAAVTGDRIAASFAGCVLSCDALGQVDWLRRQHWLPPEQDPTTAAQEHDSPLIDDGCVYISQPGVRSVECLDIATGRLRWRQVLPDVTGIVGLADGRLIVRAASAITALEAATGEALWSHDAGDLLDARLFDGQSLIFARREPVATAGVQRPVLVRLDAATGAVTGTSPLDSLGAPLPLLGPLVRHGDRVWAFFGRGEGETGREIVELTPAP